MYVVLRLIVNISIQYYIFNAVMLTSAQSDIGTVISVNVLFRHGDRTLKSTYSTDPNKNPVFWPEGYGQLTNEGKLHQFELGQWLRRRYDRLLTETYSPEIIRVRSTNVDRTLMSALCNLAGMFPPKGAQVWSKNLTWQPIPVHTIPAKLDNVLADVFPDCPAYHEELQRVLKYDKKVKRANKKFSELYKILNEYTERGNITSLFEVHWIYDILSTEQSRHLPLPSWADSIYPEPMRTAVTYGLTLETFTAKLARLRSGLLIKEMVANMVNKKENKTTPSVHVYSAHDRTISNLLHSLGAFNFIIPPFTACVMMELTIDTRGDYHVTLFYRNSTKEEPYLLQVAGCTPVCPLEKFISLSEHLIPKDWKEECKLPFFTTRASFVTFVVGIIVVVIVLIFAFAACGCRERNAAVVWYDYAYNILQNGVEVSSGRRDVMNTCSANETPWCTLLTIPFEAQCNHFRLHT